MSETFLWCEQYRPKDVESCILPKNLKLLSGTYNVGVSSKNISYFKNTNVDIEYWIALEPESKYNG